MNRSYRQSLVGTVQEVLFEEKAGAFYTGHGKNYIRVYAPGEDLKNPYISPLFGDFTGFPPTLIQVGDNEILLSDALSLHKKMVKENVPVKIDVFKRMWHVFQMSPLKTAHEAMEQCAEFIYDICR